MAIIVKSPSEIAAMRRAGVVVASILKILSREIRAGMTTAQLDDIAVRERTRYGAAPSFKGYRGFPAAVCVSINEEIVHGIPGEQVIQEGDIVSLDFGAIVDGFHGDAALTIGVGSISPQAKQLLETTSRCLEVGIAVARPGAHLSDISATLLGSSRIAGYSRMDSVFSVKLNGRLIWYLSSAPSFSEPGTDFLCSIFFCSSNPLIPGSDTTSLGSTNLSSSLNSGYFKKFSLDTMHGLI